MSLFFDDFTAGQELTTPARTVAETTRIAEMLSLTGNKPISGEAVSLKNAGQDADG